MPNVIVKFGVKLILPIALDFLIKIGEHLSKQSDNSIDDDFVETIKENRELIINTLNII